MALIIADRVLETSTTTGSGALTLLGAVAGYRAASAVCANGDTFYYYIEGIDANGNPDGSGWETGLATWGTGNTLTRAPDQSSNGGAAVAWGAGTRRVAMALTAALLKTLIPTRFTSGQVAIPAANTVASVAHGLGVMPFSYQVSWECVTAEASFAVGDRVDITGQRDGDGARRFTTWCNATTINFVSVTGVFIAAPDGVSGVAGTAANWRLVFRAQA